jgi:hypothetical protein
MERFVVQLKEGVSADQVYEFLAPLTDIHVVDCNNKHWIIDAPKEGRNDLWNSHLFELLETQPPGSIAMRGPPPPLRPTTSVIDPDVLAMSEVAAKEKLQEIRNVTRWWASQKKDDRCWLDDVKVMKTILPHGEVNFEMPDDLEFIENCIRFKRTRCPVDPKLHEW